MFHLTAAPAPRAIDRPAFRVRVSHVPLRSIARAIGQFGSIGRGWAIESALRFIVRECRIMCVVATRSDRDAHGTPITRQCVEIPRGRTPKRGSDAPGRSEHPGALQERVPGFPQPRRQRDGSPIQTQHPDRSAVPRTIKRRLRIRDVRDAGKQPPKLFLEAFGNRSPDFFPGHNIVRARIVLGDSAIKLGPLRLG